VWTGVPDPDPGSFGGFYAAWERSCLRILSRVSALMSPARPIMSTRAGHIAHRVRLAGRSP